MSHSHSHCHTHILEKHSILQIQEVLQIQPSYMQTVPIQSITQSHYINHLLLPQSSSSPLLLFHFIDQSWPRRMPIVAHFPWGNPHKRGDFPMSPNATRRSLSMPRKPMPTFSMFRRSTWRISKIPRRDPSSSNKSRMFVAAVVFFR